MKLLVYVCLIFTFSSCNNHKVNMDKNPLLGSWKMQKITWISKEKSYPNESPHEGIFLFTPNSYSIQWTPTEKPRVPFINLSKPTDAEKVAGFVSVVFNSGSYTITNNTVTTKAYIAKVPGFEGGIQYYTFTIDGDRLSLTMFDETYPDGNKPNWAGKWKTEFILQRVATS